MRERERAAGVWKWVFFCKIPQYYAAPDLGMRLCHVSDIRVKRWFPIFSCVWNYINEWREEGERQISRVFLYKKFTLLLISLSSAPFSFSPLPFIFPTWELCKFSSHLFIFPHMRALQFFPPHSFISLYSSNNFFSFSSLSLLLSFCSSLFHLFSPPFGVGQRPELDPSSTRSGPGVTQTRLELCRLHVR